MVSTGFFNDFDRPEKMQNYAGEYCVNALIQQVAWIQII